MKTALVIHVPHASTDIPADVRSQFDIDDATLAEEIRVMSDHMTDTLFDVAGAQVIKAPIEVNRRLYLDEASARALPAFDAVRSRIQTTVSSLASLLKQA